MTADGQRGTFRLVSSLHRGPLSSLLRRLGGEPFLLFALPAMLLFGLHALIATPDRETIIVPAETVDGVVKAREEALLRPLSDRERAAAIEAHVEDELLLREAFARGLHQSDPQVRDRLINRVRILLADEPPTPDDADLRAFFEANREAYRSERTVTLEHVFFNRPAGEDRIEEVLEALRGGADATDLGDRFWLGQHLERYTLRELAAVLGRDFATVVFGQALGGWRGPVASNRGLHLVRVLEVNQPEPLSFEQLKPYLEADWLEAERGASIDAKLSPIRARYRIEIEEPPR